MFTPIKKILSYIQKNARPSNMFASSYIKTNIESESTTEQNAEDSIGLLKTQNSADQSLLQLSEDDIELHIKPSLIEKTRVAVECTVELDDELADFAYDPAELINPADSSEEYYLATDNDSAGVEANDEANDVVHGDMDGLEKEFLELDSFEDKEVIVFNENEHNTSITSDDSPSEDPLAIDDFNPFDHEIDNPLANDDASIIWLALDDNSEQQQQDGPSSGQPKNNTIPQDETAEELGSDMGSDSGLGNETSMLLQATINRVADLNPNETVTERLTNASSMPSNDILKTASHCVLNDESQLGVNSKIIKPLRSNLKRRSGDTELNEALVLQTKRPKRSVNFDTVEIFYFQRQQGFSCVPTQGGCSLGMAARHISSKILTLTEHAAEIRRAHRLQLIQPRSCSSDDTEESEEDYLSEGGSGSDQDAETNGFLQPVSPKQRRALLKAAGVRKIDPNEKIECRNIRNSREICGCSCREFCDPETCACNQAGIKCQVDRAMFPCGCTGEACGNTIGRIEFNPSRVRTHYIHTIMRLDIEREQDTAVLSYPLPSTSAAAASASSSDLTNSYFNMQSQSNYSSGYASPAYTSDATLNYYQQHQHSHEQHQTYIGLQDLHTPPQYQLDSLDASNLFTSGANTTAAYSELLQPAYYNSPNNHLNAQRTNESVGVNSRYASHYHQAIANNNYQMEEATTISATTTYSSCSVPSVPPFGNATTTAATPHYHHLLQTVVTPTVTISELNESPTFLAVNLTPAVAINSDTDGDNYINLNAPIGSSSHISQILQQNRNTTTKLVAISQAPNLFDYAMNKCKNYTANNTTAIESLDTPPIEECQKSCMLSFENSVKTTTAIAPNDNITNATVANKSIRPQARQPLSTSPTSTMLPDCT